VGHFRIGRDIGGIPTQTRLGYAKNETTPHGFRSMVSTLLNQHDWNRDWLERQLAHGEGNSVRVVYNFSEHLPQRRKMIEGWADFLDRLAANANVVPMRRSA
jgi:integrase